MLCFDASKIVVLVSLCASRSGDVNLRRSISGPVSRPEILEEIMLKCLDWGMREMYWACRGLEREISRRQVKC